jgi:hypothetical protein
VRLSSGRRESMPVPPFPWCPLDVSVPIERNKPARCSSWVQARFTSSKSASKRWGRAMNTKSHPPATLAICQRTASRNRRLARFRCTAPPTRSPVVKPKRGWSRSFGSAHNTTRRCAQERPCWRTARNRSRSRSRYRRSTSMGRASMPHQRADSENPASPQPTCLQNPAPPCRSHAGAKAMHPVAASDFGLKCALGHKPPLLVKWTAPPMALNSIQNKGGTWLLSPLHNAIIPTLIIHCQISRLFNMC